MINHNLRMIRSSSGMTQEQVAERLGVTRQALSSYESGRTRPDIDTLIRLAEIYGCTPDDILYGPGGSAKARLRINRTAIAILILVLVLLIAASALQWSANHFFPLNEGPLAGDEMVIFESRTRLSDAHALAEGLAILAARLGSLVLFIMLFRAKCVIPLKHKLIYVVVFIVAPVICVLPFALTDRIFGHVNYLISASNIAMSVIIFSAAHFITEAVMKRKKQKIQ